MPRDPKKVDDAYQFMKMREARYAEMEAQAEIDTNANTTIIDITPIQEAPQQINSPKIDTDTGEILNSPAASTQETMPGLNF